MGAQQGRQPLQPRIQVGRGERRLAGALLQPLALGPLGERQPVGGAVAPRRIASLRRRYSAKSESDDSTRSTWLRGRLSEPPGMRIFTSVSVVSAMTFSNVRPFAR